jgi:Flp pilus assembly protein TadD
MNKSLSPNQTPSPFFDLLADADEVQIRESTSQDSGRVRSFVVHIKTPVAQIPNPISVADYDYGRLLQSAELLLESSDYVLARNLFSYLLNENLKDARALRGLGICLFHLSDRVSARKCFKAWHEVHQSNEALLWLGKSFAADGDSASALTAFSQIPHQNQLAEVDRLDWLKTMGTCHAKIGNLGQAEELFRAALALQPQNDSLWVHLGSLEIQRGIPTIAERSFRQALQAQPRNSKAYCGLGLVALAANNSTLACAYFHKALELDNENWLALEQWAAAFSQGMEFKRLETHMLRYLEIFPGNGEALALCADLYDRNSKRFEAERYLYQALQADPKNVRALLLQSRMSQNV